MNESVTKGTYSEIIFFKGSHTTNFSYLLAWCLNELMFFLSHLVACLVRMALQELAILCQKYSSPLSDSTVCHVSGHRWCWCANLRRRHARTDHFRIHRWGTSSVRGRRAPNVTWLAMLQWVFLIFSESLSRLFPTSWQSRALRWAVFVEMASVHENVQLAQQTGAAWSTATQAVNVIMSDFLAFGSCIEARWKIHDLGRLERLESNQKVPLVKDSSAFDADFWFMRPQEYFAKESC